ncbi:histone-lysine N-methyltransferase ASHR3 [Humulus lupulus]|uniref:histone-lysine N-methyltransferase ASHR3 n=1 Tax=Humulus lupulus TaxID=3486 RepID=UPI002B4064AA|nr:histone-lysine N-methyltransferase ASHR3 [Humulus lupulus]
MPDLGNLSFSASLAISRCPNFISTLTDSPDPTSSPFPNSVKAAISIDRIQIGVGGKVRNGTAFKVLKRNRPGFHRTKKASTAKTLQDHVRNWVSRKKESGVPESRCSLPFLVGAKKMVECLVCHFFIYPGEELVCSVRGCLGGYHIKCVKDKKGSCNVKKFKCPQHACFICKQNPNWRCVKCTMASHDKCAAWPGEVIHLKDQPGRAVCWRHPTDGRLDWENAASTSDIEEVFCRLPLPYIDEEFKIDCTWKDTENKMEPPPFMHIRRNIYLVKKKRDDADDGTGCTSCSSECSQNCVCRVQCISCSKACRCSGNCTNRPFRKEKKIKIVKTEHCGWGVEAAESINKDEFVVEYIGEVIDDALCEQRLWSMKDKGVHNFYMCEIRKDFTIDATFKGNSSRFLNHSCNPNCILEKWQVEGETRVGVFAARSIEVGEPLTYDYRFVQFGPEVRCHCGATNCQGYLGTKKKIDKVELLKRQDRQANISQKPLIIRDVLSTETCWGLKRKRSSMPCIAATHYTIVTKHCLLFLLMGPAKL